MDTKTPPFSETWGALEKLVEAGKCKNIGLSNFNIAQVIYFCFLYSFIAQYFDHNLITFEHNYNVNTSSDNQYLTSMEFSKINF
jgi:aryl-alcohol dehydrogenase-like predicted oxidoreductase